jgi:hypothetical protein
LLIVRKVLINSCVIFSRRQKTRSGSCVAGRGGPVENLTGRWKTKTLDVGPGPSSQPKDCCRCGVSPAPFRFGRRDKPLTPAQLFSARNAADLRTQAATQSARTHLCPRRARARLCQPMTGHTTVLGYACQPLPTVAHATARTMGKDGRRMTRVAQASSRRSAATQRATGDGVNDKPST